MNKRLKLYRVNVKPTKVWILLRFCMSFRKHTCHHFWVGLLGAIANPSKSDDKFVEKSVQLARGSSFRNDLL